jgi:N-methylhydantoinase A/oxoprolinase/acetone carboxylase beta subunit
MQKQTARLGVDIGGTFTDVVLERSCVSKRSATEILKDLTGGYITAQAAEALYGLAPKQIANALA